MGKQKTMDLPRYPVPEGLTCPKCGAAMFKTSVQVAKNNHEHVRLDCAACGRFVRFLKQKGEPAPRHESVPDDAHAQATAPPPASWHWIGLLRQSDQVWRAVALAPTLERCWDTLLHHPGEGDRLCIPTRPVGRAGEG